MINDIKWHQKENDSLLFITLQKFPPDTDFPVTFCNWAWLMRTVTHLSISWAWSGSQHGPRVPSRNTRVDPVQYRHGLFPDTWSQWHRWQSWDHLIDQHKFCLYWVVYESIMLQVGMLCQKLVEHRPTHISCFSEGILVGVIQLLLCAVSQNGQNLSRSVFGMPRVIVITRSSPRQLDDLNTTQLCLIIKKIQITVILCLCHV